MYRVWVADLESLYDDIPRPAVVDRLVDTEDDAKLAVSEIQDHVTAAWYDEA